MEKHVCKNCNKEYKTNFLRQRFCSKQCSNEFYKNEKLNRTIEGEENINFVICKICGYKAERIYGNHLKHIHNITSDEYKKRFPGERVCSLIDHKNVNQHRGDHMKTEKYKKMFSEMFGGENNRNHKSNTTEQQRKERSPFSKEFYKKRNLTEEVRQEFLQNALKDRIFNTTVEYYIQKGYSVEEAKILLKDRQTTFSLEKCIKKYGEKEGLEKWKDRQEKWLTNYKKTNFSKISQKLFCEIYESIKQDFNEIYFAILNKTELDLSGINHEYVLNIKNKVVKPDFYIKDNNKIIEFDGVYWHKTDIVNKKREKNRDEKLKNSGYLVYHVREDDYYKNSKETIKKCIDFIYENNN
jgi:very-short-patch-repair endonuclease